MSKSAAVQNRRASPSTKGEGGGEDAREAAKRIVDWDDNGRLADDEWLVERNETAIIAICRALLSSPDARREALEEAAKVAEAFAERAHEALRDATEHTRQSCVNRHSSGISIAAQIRRALSPPVGKDTK